MSKTKKIHTILLLLILILFITIISFSFAAFNTRITNSETQTTIATGSGIMEITYSSGEVINVPNIFPDNNPFITKEFTVIGNNSNPTENMYYHLHLVLDENTFRSSAITYTLESNNIHDNGYTVPEITAQTGIKTGEREIFLGNGMFTPTNNEDKVHSYTLKLYFPKIEHFEHGVDQGKTFKAHIETREGEVYPGYNHEKGVNHPVLFTGMTPVKWDGTTEIETIEEDSDWYDYDEKRWANAKSQDGSYWVWIPRYAYKIESCYHMSWEDCEALTGKQAGDIDVKFLKSTTNITEDNTPIESTGYEAHVKDTSMHHFLHPAFQFNGEELGFWMAKFEPSVADQETLCYTNPNITNCNNTNLISIIIPNVSSRRYISIYNAFKLSREMKYKTDIYGWHKDELDVYMINNHNWGAITYLSKSQYGATTEIWSNANNKYITGCAGSEVDSRSEDLCMSYNSLEGQRASTTHNIYGIYDMSGGSREYTVSNFMGNTELSGFSYNELLGLESKYIIKYNNNNQFLFGDAMYETSVISDVTSTWYNGNSYFPAEDKPWITRGGHYSYGISSGLFIFRNSDGKPNSDRTYRPILTSLK